jgi:ribosome-binding protein aMBF1 (putative translation factor)
MTRDTKALLKENIELFHEALQDFEAYSFCADVRSRMDARGLSSSALGERMLVSHTIVDRWRQGKARPNGKERMKKLGMALGMDAEELDAFLYRNGYPSYMRKTRWTAPLSCCC